MLSEEVGTPIIGGTVDVCSTDLTITATPVTMEGNGPNSASIGFVAGMHLPAVTVGGGLATLEN